VAHMGHIKLLIAFEAESFLGLCLSTGIKA
jgi:hypothetical protein